MTVVKNKIGQDLLVLINNFLLKNDTVQLHPDMYTTVVNLVGSYWNFRKLLFFMGCVYIDTCLPAGKFLKLYVFDSRNRILEHVSM